MEHLGEQTAGQARRGERAAPGKDGRPRLGCTCAADRSARPAVCDGAADDPRQPPTVLVAEDDGEMRGLYTEVLRSGGYRVLTARDGAEAAALAGAEDLQIDAIVTDVVMPGMRGDEVVERIRLRWTRIPVLLVSGYALDARRLAARFGPRVAFLHKPFTPEALLEHLEQLLTTAGRT